MVATVDELRRARELVDEARDPLAARGVAVPARLEVGIMVEVPSAALVAAKLAPLADFFSGHQRPTQYTLAAERGNAGVAALADPLHPAVLRLIDMTARAAVAAGRDVAVCGEIAGDRLAVPLLLGLGVRELSRTRSRSPQSNRRCAPPMQPLRAGWPATRLRPSRPPPFGGCSRRPSRADPRRAVAPMRR